MRNRDKRKIHAIHILQSEEKIPLCGRTSKRDDKKVKDNAK